MTRPSAAQVDACLAPVGLRTRVLVGEPEVDRVVVTRGDSAGSPSVGQVQPRAMRETGEPQRRAEWKARQAAQVASTQQEARRPRARGELAATPVVLRQQGVLLLQVRVVLQEPPAAVSRWSTDPKDHLAPEVSIAEA
jgi:hypothetical protein